MFLLATEYKRETLRFPVYVQPKLNGLRAQKATDYYSRDRNLWEKNMTEHLAELPLDYIYDGEFYHHGWSLQRINSAMSINRLMPNEETKEIEYLVFDLVIPAMRQKDRLTLLSDLVSPNRCVPTHIVSTQQEADYYYDFYISQGYEGLIYRFPSAMYTHGRSKYLQKRKDFKDEECIVVGITPGEGKYIGLVGALICQREDGKTFKVGTGMDDADRERFQKEPPIGQRVKIQYIALSDDGLPLNASLL